MGIYLTRIFIKVGEVVCWVLNDMSVKIFRFLVVGSFVFEDGVVVYVRFRGDAFGDDGVFVGWRGRFVSFF